MSVKVWTAEECEIFRKRYPTANNKDLAKLFGVSVNMVRHQAVRLGVKKHVELYRKCGGMKKKNENNYQTVKSLIGQTPVNVNDIIQSTGLGYSVVRNIIERLHSSREIRRVSENCYSASHDDFVRSWLCRAWRN